MSSKTALVCKGAVTQGSVCIQGYFQETTLAYRSDCDVGCRMMMRKPTHNPAAPHLLNVTSTLPYIYFFANSPPVTAISPLTPNSPLPLHDPPLLSELCFYFEGGGSHLFLKVWCPTIPLEKTEFTATKKHLRSTASSFELSFFFLYGWKCVTMKEKNKNNGGWEMKEKMS